MIQNTHLRILHARFSLLPQYSTGYRSFPGRKCGYPCVAFVSTQCYWLLRELVFTSIADTPYVVAKGSQILVTRAHTPIMTQHTSDKQQHQNLRALKHLPMLALPLQFLQHMYVVSMMQIPTKSHCIPLHSSALDLCTDKRHAGSHAEPPYHRSLPGYRRLCWYESGHFS